MFEIIEVKTSRRIELIDITDRLKRVISGAGAQSGMCHLSIPHTTAGITINENADPAVKIDISSKLASLIPAEEGYSHIEGNSDSHLKSSIIGSTLSLIIDGGSLVLGTWQGIFFCEFDGPRNRKLYIKIING